MSYIPDPGDIELVLAAFRPDIDLAAGNFYGAEDHLDATAVLTALAAAGRLLPTGGSAKIEYAHGILGGHFHEVQLVHGEWRRCDRCDRARTVVVWPIEGLANNYWSRFVGPWVAVDEGSAK